MGEKWNKRWFVLYEDGILAYYANQVLAEKKNAVSLKGSKLKVLPKEHIKRRPHCFELETKDRTFLLSCRNEQGYRLWMYWLSKGHPEAPRERSGSFFNTVIDQVLQEAEVQNRRQSLTRRVTAAAENVFRARERVLSLDERKVEEPDIQIFDNKRFGNDSDSKPSAATSNSVQRLESLRVSRPWIHLESKENDDLSLPPPESDFAYKIQDFVKENERTMEEVIDYLVRTMEK